MYDLRRSRDLGFSRAHPHVLDSTFPDQADRRGFVIMKPGSSTLNPYASSYTPVWRRMNAGEIDKDMNLVKESESEHKPVWLGHDMQGQHGSVYHSSVLNADDSQTAEISKWKGDQGGEFYASSSNYQIEAPEKSTSDDEFDMNIAYLVMTFPGTSMESIAGVYLASNCDLDATIDMLNQLEPLPADFSEKLPDTLDIGDVPQSGSSSDLAPQKLKNVTVKATDSMSPNDSPSAD